MARNWRVDATRRLSAMAGAAAVAFGLVACAAWTDREAVAPGSELGVQLGFIRDPGCRRGLVEARLGDPASTFEGGRIVAYAVYDTGGRLSLSGGRDCYGLMIEYGDDGRVARFALIRHGSARCQKD